MQKTTSFFLLLTAFMIILLATFAERDAFGNAAQSPYAEGLVSDDGSITLPKNFRSDYVMLGAWSVANDSDTGDDIGLHVVYAPKSAVVAYRAEGSFPDGTVLVKELFASRSESLTTGEATSATNILGYFIMVKDNKGRFPNNPLWGDGWGWAYFAANDRARTTTTDYRTDCLGCHEPARDTDYIYSHAYPVLR